jgi:hypothetical protein
VARLLVGDNSTLLIEPPRLVFGALHVTINSVPGQAYVLEGTTNLLEPGTNVLYWTPLDTNTASGATLDFIDPNVPVFENRFYRVRRFGP